MKVTDILRKLMVAAVIVTGIQGTAPLMPSLAVAAAEDAVIAEARKKYDVLMKGAQADIAANNMPAAEKKLKEAVNVSDPISDGELKLTAQTRLGDVYVKQKKWKEAEAIYKEAYDNNCTLYRGNYPILLETADGLKQVYLATGRQKDAEKIVKQAKDVRASRYSVAAIDNADLFASYYESLRDVLVKNDTKAAVKLFKYPFSVRWNSDGPKNKVVTTRKSYKTEAEMLTAMPAVFTPSLVKLFKETPERQLWCRDQGVMLGGGGLWLVGVPLVTVGGKPAYRLQDITINK